VCPNAHGWPLKGRQSPSTGSPGIVPTVIPLTQSGFESQNPADSPPKVPAYPRSVQSYTANHPTDGESPAKVPPRTAQSATPKRAWLRIAESPKVPAQPACVPTYAPSPQETANRHRSSHHGPLIPPSPKRVWLRIAQPPVTQPESPPTRGTPRRSRRPLHVPPNQSGFAAKPPCPSITRSTPPLIVC
jgi:hypothetical protein